MTNILKRISDKYENLTNSQMVVANYISDNIYVIAFDTLDELAAKIGVSTTTVIRFARALGYAGFSDMQQDVQENIKGKDSLPERFCAVSSNINRDQLLLDTFRTDINNLNQTLAELNGEQLNRAVSAIISARQIYILGMRSSFSLAHMLFSRLGQIKKNVRLIHGMGMTFPEEINGIEEGDICIAFLFPRYCKITATLLSWMKKQGVTILLVTDRNHAQVKAYGDIILPCATQGISYKSSPVAPLSLVNYLVAAVSIEYDGAKESLAATEEMLKQGYYLGL
ncbi:MAG: MurR/RpiR family transcriptional regulator [Christensenellales bacterium]|jgi:DNA-binding MurR/RpiR family transcriptional regulator